MLKRRSQHKMSLKLRITLLVGSVLVVIAGMLTIFSIMNGNMHFNRIEPTFSDMVMNAQLVASDSSIRLDKEILSSSDANLTGVTAVKAIKLGFSQTSIYIMIGLIIVGLLITYFVVGKALEPLTKLSITVADIGEHNFESQESIEPANFSGEIMTLTNSFNAMFTRIQAAFTQQKQFAMNAAHELKTPLATMKTSLQVLNIGEPDIEDYKENAEVMSDSVEHLISLVQNLLLTSSMAAEENINEKVSLDIIVQDCIQGMQSQIIDKELRVDVKTCSCPIRGNLVLLQSVVQNLIENAVKYSNTKGLVEVSILVSQENETATLTVTDCGIGIESKNLPYVFDAFYRADKSRSKEIQGNGLGLSIVKNIVERYGGTITIDSVIEKGTIVAVKLPLEETSINV